MREQGSVGSVVAVAARGVTRVSRRVIDLLLIFTRTTQPPDKQGAKACARAVLPHSIPLGALRLVRSRLYRAVSFSCSLVAAAIPRHSRVRLAIMKKQGTATK